jgi:SAM-dependent methyltransferase
MPRRADIPEDPAQIGLYTDARVYDILHAPGTAEELRALQRIARAHVRTRARIQTWLEPACGTARLLRAAARRGIRPVGFDLSPEMVRYARERLAGATPRARVLVAGFTDFAARMRPGSVDLAFCTINTIRHIENDAEVLAHLGQVARVLRPGGVYIVGLSVTIYGMESPSEDVWEGARGGLRVKQVIGFLPPERGRFETALSHLIVRRRAARKTITEHRDSAYRLRTYSLGQWTSLLRRSALELRAVTDGDGVPIDPPTLGYALWVLAPRRDA